MAVGIYQITNIKNGKYYIGSSINITKRWDNHLENLIYNTHMNYKLQEDFNKYGIEAFNFSVVEIVKDRKFLLRREQEWLDGMEIENNYNIIGYSVWEHRGRITGNYDILNFKISKKKSELLRKNLVICERKKLNAIGEKETSLSKSWYGKVGADGLDLLSRHNCNYSRHIAGCGAKEFYWTAFFKDAKIANRLVK